MVCFHSRIKIATEFQPHLWTTICLINSNTPLIFALKKSIIHQTYCLSVYAWYLKYLRNFFAKMIPAIKWLNYCRNDQRYSINQDI